MSYPRPDRQSVASNIDYKDVVELDDRLSEMNLRRQSVPNDGNCFYSAVADQLTLLSKNMNHYDVRTKAVTFLRKNAILDGVKWGGVIHGGIGERQYLQKQGLEGEWADDVMIQATSSALNYVINIVTKDEWIRIMPDGVRSYGEIWLGRLNGASYLSLHKTRGKEVKTFGTVREFSLIDSAKQNGGILKNYQTSQPNLYETALGGDPLRRDVMNGPGMNPSDQFDFADEEPLIEEDLPEFDKYYCEPPEDDSRTTTTTLKFFQKLFKLLSYLIFGGFVLAGGLVNKACVLVLGNSAKVYVRSNGDNDEDLKEHDVLRAWSYIVLLCMMLLPEVLTMGYSMYRIIMKKESPLEMSTFLWGGLWELLSAFGEAIIFIKVLPYLDATYASLAFPLMTFIPICIDIHAKFISISHNRHRATQPHIRYKRYRGLALAILAFLLQTGGLITCFGGLFTHKHNVTQENGPNITVTNSFQFLNYNYTYIWAFVGFILASCRYWENFVTGDFDFPFGFKIEAHKLQEKIDHSRFRFSFLTSLIKSGVLVGFTFLTFVVLEDKTYHSSLTTADKAEERYAKVVGLLSEPLGQKRWLILQSLLYVFATQACCSLAAFFFARVACLTIIQREAYAFPAVLVTPIISALTAAVAVFKWDNKASSLNGLLSYVGLANEYRNLVYYIDWNAYIPPTWSKDSAQGEMIGVVIVGLALGWLATILFSLFIWKPTQNRLERTEVLFVKAVYAGPVIDQVLMINRRQFEKVYAKSKAKKDEEDEKKRSISRSNSRSTRRRFSRRLTMSRSHKFTPQLFLCATMWHETEQEMTQILTSLMRLDRDQGSRRGNSTTDPDYYNFQVHVLFDDAMERTKDGETKTNRFVHQLCELIPLAANKVELGRGYDLPPPVIYPTPYGGRLEFILPHGNLMVVHLKDKEKIRHRKRWSQCMYMYYILGYLQATKKAYKLEDVFLLALDGDVDFQPNAVLLLLDRMKRNPDVGAACGRIHPTGSGPVVWFQKFEYAVGHWLQKTAEHVLGCVLCSPGCFSMFRGASLVDVNVMNRYTTKATEALHYVQWDQGEDRWLCTLLLKQGWRIEYSAASDSFTFAPEEFKEFYNQRRRWGPSTMANIFDILMDAKLTVTNNTYISWGYITYQIGLMISSILGPATVIMIVQGAYQYVFSWSAIVSLIVSLIPVIIFIILCYTTSSDTQVAVAGILTILYALVMMAVIVGVIGAMVTTVILDPNSLFMILLVGLYAFTGIVHPQEMMCLIHGVLYYLCVPSAFIFLMVYSLTNMNNVSWGTREVKKIEVEQDESAHTALEQVANKPLGKSMQIGPKGASIYDAPASSEGYYSCGLGNMCQCALCITPKPVYIPVPQSEPKTQQPQMNRRPTMARRATLAQNPSLYRKYSQAKQQQITGIDQNQMERRLSTRMSVHQLRRISNRLGSNITTASVRKMSQHHRRMSRRSTTTFAKQAGEQTSEQAEQLARELDEEMPQTMDDVDLEFDDEEDEEVGDERLLEEGDEMLYWVMDGPLEEGVIEYLDDEEREFWKYLIKKYLYPLDEDKAEKLRIKNDLKDLRNKMTGAYFLANALWLVLNFALQLTITDIAISFVIEGTVVSVNPVSFLFLLFFLVILVIQFTCMLAHRWSTGLHLLSVTSLKWNDARDGLQNTKTGDIERETRKRERQKHMKKVNGMIASDPEDPMTSIGQEQTTAENFSFKRNGGKSEGYVNDTYDDAGPSGSTSSDSDSEDPYETLPGVESGRFRSPMNTWSKQFTNTKPGLPPKSEPPIDMGLFSDSKSKLVRDDQSQPSIFSGAAADDIMEQHINDEHKVRFATTGNDSADEGNTQF